MKKLTKFMSVLLSLVLTLSLFSVCASAASYEDDVNYVNYVDYAELQIDTDIAGVDAEDYYDYITILSPELKFEDDYGDPAVFVEDAYGNEIYDEFIEGETYCLYVYLTYEEGYAFDEESYFYAFVNGVEVDEWEYDWWNPYGDLEDDTAAAAIVVEYVEIVFEITVGEAFGYEVIDSIDIDIDIQPGTLAGDYYNYITINTDNLDYDDEFGYKALYAYYNDDYDSGELAADYAFEADTVYDLDLYFGAAEGYYISNYAEVYINGELYDGYFYAGYDSTADGEFEYSYCNIELEDYLVEAEELTFWQMIVNFFTGIFDAIANFFNSIFG